MTDRPDLLVIGGGAAGLAAARAGTARGARPMLVSAGLLGGDCTWTGCVPSKSLIEAAGAGLTYPAARARMIAQRAGIAATEDAAALAREGIDVRSARARFVAPGRFEVDGTGMGDSSRSGVIEAHRVVLATGSEPSVPAIPGLSDIGHLTTDSVFDLPDLPGSLAVLGAGPVGCELAQVMARFGCRVTLIEAAERVLPGTESGASAVVDAALRADGVEIWTGAAVDAVAPGHGSGVRLRLHGDGGTGDGGTGYGWRSADIVAERLLVATGRRPRVAGLDLSAGGVGLTATGHIRVDDRLRTTARGVFAAGDVTGLFPFTHAADAMGRVAAENALTRRGRARFRTHATPWAVFTDPEVAGVGLTVAQARAVPGAMVCHLPLDRVDRALLAGRAEGFVTVIAGPRWPVGSAGGGRVLGATIVAPRAGEMIAEVALAMRTRMFTGRLAQATHAYPTWGTAVQMAAAQLFVEVAGRRAVPAASFADAQK